MSLVGGLISGLGAREAQKNAEKSQMFNYLAQKEFAQNGIRWKVDDAKAAGIHPLFALGANTSGFAPVGGFSGDSGLGALGQSIDSSIMNKQTKDERIRTNAKEDLSFALDMKQKEANIALTQAQISAMAVRNQQLPPPMPSLSDNGEIIQGQAQSYPTAGTKEKPVEVVSSFKGGYQQAGHNPDVSYGKTQSGFSNDMSDYQKDKTEDNIIAMLQWANRNNLTPVPPPYKPKKGYHWEFSLSRGEWTQVRDNFIFRNELHKKDLKGLLQWISKTYFIFPVVLSFSLF